MVEVEKIVNGGYGLARTKRGVCLIPYAVPEDILDVECSKDTNPSFCWIKRIIQPSIYRVTPLCPNFSICGGCDFLNIEYDYELEIKKNIIIEDLKRISKIELANIDVLNSKPSYYRNNVQFKTDEKGNIGFFRKKSNEVIPLPKDSNECMLIDHRINDFIWSLIGKIDFKRGGFRVRSNREGDVYKKGIPGIADDKYCYYKVLGNNYRVGIDDFFQVNNYLYEEWLKLVIDYINPESSDIIVDLFAGSGYVTIPAAKKAQKVVGMEVNGSAVKNARYNSSANGVKNAIFKRVDVNRGFYLKEKFTKVVIDPPRSGLSRQLIDELVDYAPEIVVYASCNTATFSRDIGVFCKKGYRIEKFSMIDMFPRTAHVEVVAKLINS